jgi:Protein  of unknown function (DUF3018)
MNAPARMTGAERMAKHRANLRAKGYKLKQYWLPDLNDPKMQADIKRGIAAINASEDEAEVMAFAALNFEEIMANEPDYDWGPAGPPEGSNTNA